MHQLKKYFWYPPYPFRMPLLYLRKQLVPNRYGKWLKERYPNQLKEAFSLETAALPPDAPAFSLITLIYNPKLSHLKKCVESVRKQNYTNFEWILINNGSTSANILKYLDSLEDKHFHVHHLKEGLGIAKGTREAVKLAKGPWLAFLDHDDVLDSSALADFAKVAALKPDISFIYSDSDHVDEVGRRFRPILKPDPSPEYILGTNYVCHFHAITADLYHKMQPQLSDAEGSQDWDLTLRTFFSGEEVYHVSKVLYSQRVHPKQYSSTANNTVPLVRAEQVRCLQKFLKDQNLSDYRVMPFPESGLFYISYEGAWEKDLTIRQFAASSLTPTQFWYWLESVKTPYFAFMEAHIKPLTKSWQRECVGVLHRRKDVALVGGKLVETSGKELPAESSVTLRSLNCLQARIDPPVRREVSALSPGFWVGRTDAFLDLDRNLGTQNFFVEAQLQLANRGYQILFDPLLVAQAERKKAKPSIKPIAQTSPEPVA